ncbi:hypothetical protein JXD38_09470 [candidate division WOR-3 bacterium]|nr:hypothetical protein [candidate division WOR-3 bacterium]
MKHAPLVYIETSVFGFFADELPHNRIHSDAVRTLFNQMEAGALDGITSRVTIEELNDAPAALRPGLVELAAKVRLCNVDDAEAARLATRYVAQHVIPKRFAIDAQHAAYATLARADVLVSLNLQHLANEWAMRRVNAVNLNEGYPMISIRTPEEVIRYET